MVAVTGTMTAGQQVVAVQCKFGGVGWSGAGWVGVTMLPSLGCPGSPPVPTRKRVKQCLPL